MGDGRKVAFYFPPETVANNENNEKTQNRLFTKYPDQTSHSGDYG